MSILKHQNNKIYYHILCLMIPTLAIFILFFIIFYKIYIRSFTCECLKNIYGSIVSLGFLFLGFWISLTSINIFVFTRLFFFQFPKQ